MLTWVHPAYGWGFFIEDEADLDQVEIRADRDQGKLDLMAHPEQKASRGPCSFYEAEPTHYCCEIAFGSADWCK